MPLYEYERVDGPCDLCGGRFTELQRMSDAPLTQCPCCQDPVRRTLTAGAVVRAQSPASSQTVSAEQVSRAGFTQYTRVQKGVYERTAGTAGPARLVGGDD
jgi:putative FmdB family regulatory protein